MYSVVRRLPLLAARLSGAHLKLLPRQSLMAIGSRYFTERRPLMGFDDFFRRADSMFDDDTDDDNDDDFDLMPVLTGIDRPEGSILRRSSPGYEVHETDGKYVISMDIPGVKVDDLKVDVEEDGDVLYISGRRKMKIGDAMSETRFEKRFFVGENVDLDKLSAHLEDGVLTLTAPKFPEEKKSIRSISITSGGSGTQKQVGSGHDEAA